MSKKIDELTIFLSCTEELATERDIVFSAVAEINPMLKKQKSVVLNVIHWKTDAIPGVGIEPQDVINRQFDDTYDIFLGLLGTRFGTPTKLFGSGTEEEFERAYDASRKSPGSIWILFYFKSSTDVPVDKIDPDQLRKVQAFKGKLGPKRGLYYGSFATPDEFFKTVKKHLFDLIADQWDENTGTWRSGSPSSSSVELPVPLPIADVLPKDAADAQTSEQSETESGILELMVEANAGMQTGLAVLNDLSQRLGQLTARIEARTKDITQTIASGTRDPQTMIQFVDSVADDLSEFTKFMREAAPVLDQNLGRGIEALRRSYQMYEEQTGSAPEMEQESLEGIRQLPTLFSQVRQQLTMLRNTMTQLPGMTKKFNVARQSFLVQLDVLRATFTVVLGRVEGMIEDLRLGG